MAKPRKGVEPPALKRYRLAHRKGSSPRSMSSKSRRGGSRHYSRPRHRTHRRPGLIAQTVGAVRKIAHGVAKVAGPVLVAGGAIVIAAPTTIGVAQIVKSGRGNSADGITATMQDAGAKTLAGAAVGAGMIVGGIVVERAMSETVR